MLRNRLVWAAATCTAGALVMVACGEDGAFQTPPATSNTTASSGAGAQGGSGGSTTSTGGSGGTCVDGDMDNITDCDGDCDDANPNVYPNMTELCGDGLDNDCDGNGDPASLCQGLGTYVSALEGDDTAGDGTQQNPVQTITKGIQNAVTIGNGQPVFVAEGVYPEKVVVVEGNDLLGGHQCDSVQCSWARDPLQHESLIACADNLGVSAGATITRATAIDGFTIQARVGNPGSNGQIAAFTVDQGTPTISNNTVLGGQVIGCSGCSSSGITVIGPSNDALGVLIENNLVVAGDFSDTSTGIALENFGSPPVAEIAGNDVRGGSGTFTRAISAFASGAGTLITGNTVAAGTLLGNGGHSSFAITISGNSTVDANFVNTDATLVGSCATTPFWCGGIESHGATATVTNNVAFGMPSPRSTAMHIGEGEIPFGMLIVNGNTFHGGGAPIQQTGISTALSCRTAQGTAAKVGNIRNNILLGGSSVNRFGFYEDNQPSGKTCEPTAYENNDIWFPPQLNTVNNAHRQWTAAGLAVLLPDVVAVDALAYAQNNIQADPLLDNTFHLDLASPCVDAGTATEAPTFDFEMDTRPQAAGIDIGADEAK